MSFAGSRASAFALLLGTPLLQAVACSEPERVFPPANHHGGETSTSSGGVIGEAGNPSPSAGETGQAGMAGGNISQGGEIGQAGGGDVTGNGGTSSTQGGATIVGEGGADLGGSSDGGTLGIGGTVVIGAGGRITDGGTLGMGGTVVTGAGGTLGAGGTFAGGTFGMGGIIVVGAGGTVTSGGTVATSGGKATSGGTGSGGKATSGGVTGSGGATGCTPTNPATEVCTDGIDNDCNTHIDCLVPKSVFPDPNGAAAGKDVKLVLNATKLAVSTFQCRSARGTAVADGTAWTACPSGNNLTVTPRSNTESQDPNADGLWTTQVRAFFTNGATSDFFQFTYYMHHSMHGAPLCPYKATDVAFFTAARAVLADAGAFGTAANTRSPFISVMFNPPVNASLAFTASKAPGVVKLMSLRHRFIKSADDKFILLERNYSSTRARDTGCKAISIRTQDSSLAGIIDLGRHYDDDCDALVLNKAGAGACLYVDANNVVQLRVKHATPNLASPPNSPNADNFAWSKLVDKKASSQGFKHFMPKCADTTTCTGNAIYVPDKSLFPYF